MLAADTREYSIVRDSTTVAVIITSGHSANVRWLCPDNARMDTDRYRDYQKSGNKQWGGQDGVEWDT